MITIIIMTIIINRPVAYPRAHLLRAGRYQA